MLVAATATASGCTPRRPVRGQPTAPVTELPTAYPSFQPVPDLPSVPEAEFPTACTVEELPLPDGSVSGLVTGGDRSAPHRYCRGPATVTGEP